MLQAFTFSTIKRFYIILVELQVVDKQDTCFNVIWIIFNNYSPKWRWLAVDIYRAAERRGKYPTLATDTEVNSCFSIY